MAFKKRISHAPGRVINQDHAPVIGQALKCNGVEHKNHDFMKDQPITGNLSLSAMIFRFISQSNPITGARTCYLRNIMHDYPDHKCVFILKHIIRALDRVSVILIDDMVPPDQGAQWRQTQLDLAMIATLAAMERTERQWRAVLTSVGLEVTQNLSYRPDLSDSIIEVVPSQR